MPPTEIKSISPTFTKSKPISACVQKPSQFRLPTQKRSQSIPTRKTNDFRPAHKNQFNFHPHAQNQVNFDQCTKTKKFRPARKNDVNFTPAQEPRQFLYPH